MGEHERETDGLRVEIGYRDTSAANEFGVDQGASNSQINLPGVDGLLWN